MELRTYASSKEFLASVQDDLEREEALHNLMLGICLRLCRQTGWLQGQPYFATVEDAHSLVLSAIRTPPYRLILQGTPDAAALELLAADLADLAPDLPGALGPTPLAGTFGTTWRTQTGAASQLGMKQKVYELRSVLTGGDAAGSFRPAVPDDQNLVAGWTLEFQQEVLSGGIEEEVEKATARRIAQGEIYLWVDEVPVSMAAATRRTTNGTSLNLVYTPPELRRKGYGTACVATLSQHLLDSGYSFCALHADLSNPASNALYLKVGYQPVGDFEEYDFRPAP